MFKRNFFYQNNLLKRDKYYNPAGNKAFYLEYTYDNNQQVILVEKVKLDGQRLKNIENQYNANGLLIGKIEYNAKGGFLTYYKYTYD